MSRSKLALGAIGVIAAAVAGLLALYPSSITYQLRRYRHDPDSVTMWMPPLCAHGRSVLPDIYTAFDKYGKDADVGKFRAAIAAELRCIRRNQGAVTSEDNQYTDLPADPQLTSTIVRAFVQEPDAKIRDEMLTYMSELDFRAWFEVYAGIASGPYELPRSASVPTIDPYDHRRRAIAHDYERIRAEWCRIVWPVVAHRLETSGPLSGEAAFQRGELAIALGEARCADSDIALFQRIVRFRGDDLLGALLGLLAATDSADRAKRTLVPLFDGDCEGQRLIVNLLGHQLDPPVAALIATTASASPCFRESYICGAIEPAACIAQLTELLVRPRSTATAP